MTIRNLCLKRRISVHSAVVMRSENGIYIFVSGTPKDEEKAFYDDVHSKVARGQDRSRPSDFEHLWHTPDRPENEMVLRELGDLTGERILLIGNGASSKELALLDRHPDTVVYSDLSPHAGEAVLQHVDLSGYENHIVFAAIDAEALPFPDESLDIVYGYAKVHHLPDVDTFLAGAMRVLKPGGRAVFMDDAYSPIWHFSKMTWLKPLLRC